MENNSKLTEEYRLTDVETRILEVCLNPEFAGKGVLQKISAANTCRDSWYKAMKNQHFLKILNQASIDLLKGKVNDLVNATYNFAINNPKCSQDRKILLTMAGLYTDKQEVDLEAKGNIQVNFSIPRPKAEE